MGGCKTWSWIEIIDNSYDLMQLRFYIVIVYGNTKLENNKG